MFVCLFVCLIKIAFRWVADFSCCWSLLFGCLLRKLYNETILLFHSQLGIGNHYKNFTNFAKITIFCKTIIEPGVVCSSYNLLLFFITSRLARLVSVNGFVRSWSITILTSSSWLWLHHHHSDFIIIIINFLYIWPIIRNIFCLKVIFTSVVILSYLYFC